MASSTVRCMGRNGVVNVVAINETAQGEMARAAYAEGRLADEKKELEKQYTERRAVLEESYEKSLSGLVSPQAHRDDSFKGFLKSKYPDVRFSPNCAATVLGCFEPAIHLSGSPLGVTRLRELPIKEVTEIMDFMGNALNEAAWYHFDNKQFYVDASCGKVALTISFRGYGVSLYSYITGAHIGDYPHIPKNIGAICNKVVEGFHCCNVCKKWSKDYQPFSFAGSVCLECYDPKKHLPPDAS